VGDPCVRTAKDFVRAEQRLHLALVSIEHREHLVLLSRVRLAASHTVGDGRPAHSPFGVVYGMSSRDYLRHSHRRGWGGGEGSICTFCVVHAVIVGVPASNGADRELVAAVLVVVREPILQRLIDKG